MLLSIAYISLHVSIENQKKSHIWQTFFLLFLHSNMTPHFVYCLYCVVCLHTKQAKSRTCSSLQHNFERIKIIFFSMCRSKKNFIGRINNTFYRITTLWVFCEVFVFAWVFEIPCLPKILDLWKGVTIELFPREWQYIRFLCRKNCEQNS